VLLSDGQANAGEQKPSVLGAEAGQARDQLGIITSTIGVGADFQEDILAALAHQSGGRFWLISEARIEDIVKEEFSGALSVYLERPRVEVTLPSGVEVVRELNDLPKISGVYRIRPIKANDQFSFALRIRVDPTRVEGGKLLVAATLLDGAGVVRQSETTLALGPLDEYVKSPEDPRVEMVVKKYLAAASDEKIIEQMDKGDVTKRIEMLKSQSDLMRELEAKLSGAAAVSWEEMTERERLEAERELARVRMEIKENEALIGVAQLLDIMQGLGQWKEAAKFVEDAALEMHRQARKMHMHRANRDMDGHGRGSVDDLAAADLLKRAARVIDILVRDFPDLTEPLAAIRGRIDEQLANFS
ncbi:MAG: hypothetical protein ACREAC_19685, partial [Blastocatellia bacterium]